MSNFVLSSIVREFSEKEVDRLIDELKTSGYTAKGNKEAIYLSIFNSYLAGFTLANKKHTQDSEILLHEQAAEKLSIQWPLVREINALKEKCEKYLQIIIENRLHHKSPCCLCGYNGPGFYQPDTHECIKLESKYEYTEI